jgi:hypothetical protein
VSGGAWVLLVLTIVLLGGGGLSLGILRSSTIDDRTPARLAVPWVLLGFGVVCLGALTVTRLGGHV